MLVNATGPALPEGLRGDYAAARPDFTVAQDMAAYSAADHETWRTLYRRQAECLRERAATAFLDGLGRLPFRDGVPDFAAASAVLPSSSVPGRQKANAVSATAANTAVEMPRCTASGSCSAMAAAAMPPPSTAPIDQMAWKELMIDRP